jgi:TetR/AcrR family transcriptional regulator, transcriptional repressor for nem operon
VGRPRTFDEDAAVRAAMELFWTRGYQATTPAELGEALGIGRGSLYHTFGSKHELYQRALTAYIAEQRQRMIDALDGEGSTSDRIRRALAVVLDGADDPRGCMITMAAIEAPPDDVATGAVVREVLAGQREVLRTTIEDGRRLGDLPNGADTPDAGDAADAVIALLNGVRVMQRAGQAPPSLVDLAMRLL